ncbi:MAG: hypothetical protein EYC70_06695 [Planctomycetota bacterium]|nr:MAG: hypothetical protein EYC70_06695 [Planctomycetota bacterium]
MADAAPIELRLPPECEHWRAPLVSECADVARAFARLAARWPQARAHGPEPAPLRLLVAADLAEAAALYQVLQLDGDPKVARTFRQQRLAIVPLPRRDALLTQRPLPPLTWRQTLRHEMAHLLSLDRPQLQAAPAWFQEGLAEDCTDSWRTGAPQAPGMAHGVAVLALRDFLDRQPGGRAAFEALADAPGEARLMAWRIAAERACRESPQSEPWRAVQGWTLADLRLALGEVPAGEPAFVGREVDPPAPVSGAGAEELLLASWPGETVAVRAHPGFLESASRALVAQVGRSGTPEAGFVIAGAGGQQLRVRLSKFGGFAARLEPLGSAATHPLQDLPADGAIGTPREFQIQQSGGVLRLRSGDWKEAFPLQPPLRLQFYVRDGALKVTLR